MVFDFMIVIKEIVGHTHDIENESSRRDYLELGWEELNKKRIRKNTVKGTEVAILLEDASLNSGDILLDNGEMELVLRTKKESALVIYPVSYQEMGKVAYQLGNRHLPCLIEEEEIVCRYDQTLLPILEEVGVRYEKEERRFGQAFKYKGHGHQH